MLDFRAAARGVRVNQEPDAHGERPRYRNLAGMQERHDVPAEIFGRASGEGGVEVVGDGEQRADDIIGLKLVGLDQRPQQLVRGGQNLGCVVPGHGGGTPDAMQPHREGHGQ